MKKNKRWLSVLPAFAVFSGMLWALALDTEAQARLRYSCSEQIHDAFGDERIRAFSKATGIEVEKHVTSSFSAVYRLISDLADIASTTRGLYDRQKESGYVETPFCRNPLAVIVNGKNPVDSVTETQLQEIFGGKITNWRELGGPDQPIVVVVPGNETGAYKNFHRDVMKRKEMICDFMAVKSTMVIEAVGRFPWAVSFIAQADAAGREHIKSVSLNGIRPLDPKYPYHQVFFFVTKGQPEGAVKSYIDFVFSDMGKEIMKKKGLVPLSR